ncbi:MAG: TlyA family RNA methyltransferase [Clostridia bacterium]|nr:TlyA family RNA methyltransferase [Clostridia bacterium]
MRADIYLVEKGIAQSRKKAQDMISEGIVYADGALITKASRDLVDAVIEIRGEVMPYVSRGGLKLKGALDRFAPLVADMICLDIGASTGGFTDCLLQEGAVRVYAVDCGHGQLDKRLSEDTRVISIEGCNAREISREIIPEEIGLCVMDVSFISQTLIHSALTSVLGNGAYLITLIKPQFEVGRANIGKNGIVKNEKAVKAAIENVIASAEACGFRYIDIMTSPIKGGDGNTEYIGYFRYEDSCNSK